ncbi:hypothetical protein GCM10027289_24360 [Tsukamurella serpentis]
MTAFDLPGRAEPLGGPAAALLGGTGFFLLSMRQTFTLPGTYGLSLSQTLFACAAFLWLATILTGHTRLVPDRAVVIAVLSYVTASVLSFAAAMQRGMPAVAQGPADRYVIVDLTLLGLVLFILTVVRSANGLRTMLSGLVLGGALSATFAVVMVGTGVDLAARFRLPGLNTSDYLLVKNLLREGISRPQGSAGHPLELSAVLTVLIPLALALMLEAARRRSPVVWLWAGCLTVLGLGAMLTISRSAVIGTAAAVLVMCWRWPIQRIAAIVTIVGVVLGLGVVLKVQLIDAMVQTFLGARTDSSIESRRIGLEYASSQFWKQPWLGQGVGAYPALKQPVLDNQYLSRLMESGAIGLVTFVVVLVVAFVLAVRSSAAKDPSTAELGSGISGAVAAVIVISLILDTSGFIQIWYLTWLLVASAAVAHRLGRDDGAADGAAAGGVR